ncbi:MAG: GTP 3',8-cyclase MoaA [Phycisphaeraceae bacterium]
MSLALPILDPGPQRPDFALGPRSLEAIRLLRLSVTDRCNLRCVYCMPEDGISFYDRKDLLSAEQILAVADAARSIGIDHFKLTGGEPTVRSDLIDIVEGLKALDPADLSMTTNGVLLPKLAKGLKSAGLDRLTISWDSMRNDVFQQIAGRRGYQLDDLRRGIDAAMEAGFTRLKFNVVVIGGMNDREIIDFARLTLDHPWTIRFIEYMPLGDSKLLADGLDTAKLYTVDNERVMREIKEALGPLNPVPRGDEPGVGPANVYQLPDAKGRIGFISAMSRPFCETCNRLRLTANGVLRACLFDGGEADAMPVLSQPTPDREQLIRLMASCVALKPDIHAPVGNRAMSQLGG